jgi:hypothetical protein
LSSMLLVHSSMMFSKTFDPTLSLVALWVIEIQSC